MTRLLFSVTVLLVLFHVNVQAQDTELVSKKLKVPAWLDMALGDANQLEGGLHVYPNWAAYNSDFKISRVKIGMLIAIVDPAGDGSLPSKLYQLKTWATPADIPLQTEWEEFTAGGDNLGDHTATKNIKLGNNYLNNDGDANEGISIKADGGTVSASGDLYVGDDLHILKNIASASTDSVFLIGRKFGVAAADGNTVTKNLPYLQFDFSDSLETIKYTANGGHNFYGDIDFKDNVSITATTNPGLFINGGTMDLGFPDGEIFQIGTWNDATQTGKNLLAINGEGDLILEGDEDDDFELFLRARTLTKKRFIYFPDTSGTVMLNNNISASGNIKLGDYYLSNDGDDEGISIKADGGTVSASGDLYVGDDLHILKNIASASTDSVFLIGRKFGVAAADGNTVTKNLPYLQFDFSDSLETIKYTANGGHNFYGDIDFKDNVSITATTNPGLFINGGTMDLGFPDGEIFQIGTWNDTTQTGKNLLAINGEGDLILEGDEDDDFELFLRARTLTKKRFIYFPDTSGTVMLNNNIFASGNIKLGDYYLSNDGDDEGISIKADGGTVSASGDLYVGDDINLSNDILSTSTDSIFAIGRKFGVVTADGNSWTTVSPYLKFDFHDTTKAINYVAQGGHEFEGDVDFKDNVSITATTNPGLFINGGTMDLGFPDGEIFQIGTWNDTTQTGKNLLAINGEGDLILEGDEDDDFELFLRARTLTKKRFIYFPDTSGTVMLNNNISASGNIKLGDYYLSNDGDDEGISIKDNGTVSASGDLYVGDDINLSNDILSTSTDSIFAIGRKFRSVTADGNSYTTGSPYLKFDFHDTTKAINYVAQGGHIFSGDVSTSDNLVLKGTIYNTVLKRTASSKNDTISFPNKSGTVALTNDMSAGGNIKLNDYYLSNNGDSVGISIKDNGTVSASGDLYVGDDLHIFNNIASASADSIFLIGRKIGVVTLDGNSVTKGFPYLQFDFSDSLKTITYTADGGHNFESASENIVLNIKPTGSYINRKATLVLAENGLNSYGMKLQMNGSNAGDNSNMFLFLGNNNNTEDPVLALPRNPDGGMSTFYTNLTVNGNFYNPSDRRLKKNIKTLTGSLEAIKQLRGVSFDFKDTTQYAKGKQLGLIAQELQQVFPELVDTDSNGYLKVNYLQLVPVLLQALKEQQGQVELLEGKMAAITQQNNSSQTAALQQENQQLKDRLEKLENKFEAFLGQEKKTTAKNAKDTAGNKPLALSGQSRR